MDKIKKWLEVSLAVFGSSILALIVLTVANAYLGIWWAILLAVALGAGIYFLKKTAKERDWNISKMLKVGGAALLFVVAGWSMTSALNKEMKSSPAPEAHIATTEEKETARQELKDTMSLAIKSGLVSSYEFSDTKRVVYAGDVWYTQTVAFKKDFLGSIAISLKTSTGHHSFEVLDAYTNQKVAEVTAFSGSIEVYR